MPSDHKPLAQLLLITICVLMLFAQSGNCEPIELPPDETSSTNKLLNKLVPNKGFLTLQTENWSVPVDASAAWTIDKMLYRKQIVGLNNGHYGTVLRPKAEQWWGTGHTEGGREIVHSLKLKVDGIETAVEIGKTVTGKTIEFTKHSTIWKFKVQAEVIVKNNFVIERTQLEAIEGCETDLIYFFMHCFSPTSTKWIAQLPDGTETQGNLKSVNGMQVNKNCLWVAQYDPTKKLSLLCYTPQIISGPNSASMIWDLDRYHKYYLRQNKGQRFQKGDQLDYTVIVKAVPEENGDWTATQKAAKELVKLFPAK